MEDLTGEEAVEEASPEAVSEKGYRRSVAEGRFVVPTNWPKWKVPCGVSRKGRPACKRWAVVGMNTCKFHGSGGARNRELGQLRYLAWVVLGAPENLTKHMKIEHITRLSLATFAEYIFSDATPVSTDTQIKAALWLANTARNA